jgi:arginyl-tRNA synthetase
MRLETELDLLAQQALTEALGLAESAPALLRPTQDEKHGDYQVNGLMPLAKKLGKNPRDLAELCAPKLRALEAVSSAEVAGPGFINLRISDAWLARRLAESLGDRERVGVPVVSKPERVVVDFSSPNIAKQMHVGHLRSTIIGDAISKLAAFVGHHVIRDNHLGDWGHQYGLLIMGMRTWGDEKALEADPITELDRVYKLASARAKEEPDFDESARQELAKLQSGDAGNRAMWQRLVAVTRTSLDRVYGELRVTFDEWLGESAYHDMLGGVCETLVAKGLAREDDGALCVFFQEIDAAPAKLKKQKEPFIVRKRDGAYLYSTTDIATVLYRKEKFAADRAIYVVDARQSLHFEQLFAIAALLGVEMSLVHVGFGTVLGKDGTALKAREGQVITLESLLTEAKERAAQRIREGMEEGKLQIEESAIPDLARAVGIGAVKYADLMQNRLTNYQFDWDKMISFQGNSGPYLQYSHARARAIFRRGEVDEAAIEANATIVLEEPDEALLARRLARFGDVVHKAAETCQPHLVAEHLYELAGVFNGFYQRCSVLKAKDEATKASRLALTLLTARQLARSLELLGLEAVERM